jgi:hypothetical protein
VAAALAPPAHGASASPAPKVVLSGLAQPAETATTNNGDLYFTQFVAADTVTISRLPHGNNKAPVEVYRLVGSQSYINDIHFDKAGDLIFITSVATDPSNRRWALTRLDPSTGVSSELAVTTGVPDPSSGYIGPGMTLLSGTVIDLDGVDGAGTIYFAENSPDPVTGAQVADLLALDPGTTVPREVAHFAGPSGSDNIYWLTVAKTGDVYLIEGSLLAGSQPNLYQVSPIGQRILVAGTAGAVIDAAWNAGLDAAGNLYILQRSKPPGCSSGTSTTMRVSRISARDLSDWTSAPTLEPLSESTYSACISPWVGSSSFFRVNQAGDVYWVQAVRAGGGPTSPTT